MQGNSIRSPSSTPSSFGERRRDVDGPGADLNLFDDWPQREQQLRLPEEDEEQEFEFSVVSSNPENSTISAEEIFQNGQIRPIYPYFSTALLAEETKQPAPLPLGRLLKEERGEASWSSSESDELEGLEPGTYCVWTPKNREAATPGPGIRKKSNSTGSSSSNSNRWKLRNILHRSNSQGAESQHFGLLVGKQERREKAARNGAVEGAKV